MTPSRSTWTPSKLGPVLTRTGTSTESASPSTPSSTSAPRWAHLAAASGAYLLLSLVGFARMLPDLAGISHCGCGDVALGSWFLAWTPFALAHLHNPFLTHRANFPAGANLVVNTAMQLPGLLSMPVTLSFGPLASFNVASILAFTTSATTAYLACRRWARWPWAAFAGGLVYGFSPYMVNQGYEHLNLMLVAIPPLVLLACHEVLVDQRRSALAGGLVLGGLASAQFFVSSEVLASTAVMSAVGLIFLVASSITKMLAQRHALGRQGAALRARRALHAASGLAVAASTTAVATGYPIFLLLFGPGHIVGPAQGGLPSYGSNLLGPLVPTGGQLLATPGLASLAQRLFFPNTVNMVENDSYLGVTLLLLVAWGSWRFRKLPIVRFAGAMAVVAFVLSLGPSLKVGLGYASFLPRGALPFAALDHLPLLESLLPSRFANYVALFLGLQVAVVADRWRAQRLDARSGGQGIQLPALHLDHRSRARRASLDAAWLPLAALGIALAPLIPAWPYPAQPAGVPSWFNSPAPHRLGRGSVVVTYPFPGPYPARPMLWQADAGLAYRIPSGYILVPGPGGTASFNAEPSLLEAAFEAFYHGAPDPARTPATRTRVLADLARWHASAIVVADMGAEPGQAAAFVTWALGTQPVRQHGVLVWSRPPQGSRFAGPTRATPLVP